MSRKKRILGIIALSILILSLSACSEERTEESSISTEVESSDQVDLSEDESTLTTTSELNSRFVESNHVENYDEVMHVQDWEDQYPHVVASFKEGGMASDAAIEEYGEFAKSGHSQIENTFSEAYGDQFTAACLACHSGDFQWVYEDLGNDVLTTPWSEVKDQYPETDFWSCYSCHGNQPGEILTTNNTYHTKVSNSIDDYAPGEAVCGQCHTVFTGLEAITPELEGVYDVHKYGGDLDGIFDALVEGYEANPNKTNDALLDAVVYDEEAGIYTYGNGAYLDLEMFQDSPHQEMGLSCVDCHMPMETAEDGTVYRSHNVSQSVLENETSLSLCMTCHTTDSIQTTDDMVEWTRGLQNNATEHYDRVVEKLDELRDEIIAASDRGVEEETVDAAREAYARATYYIAYSTKTSSDYVEGHVPGVTSIHNYDEVIGYYDKAIDLAQEHIDILQGE